MKSATGPLSPGRSRPPTSDMPTSSSFGARTLILTGVAGNFCVLFTAHDAYMRDYRLVVPRDCVASLAPRDDRYALAHLAEVTKADVRPAGRIDLSAL